MKKIFSVLFMTVVAIIAITIPSPAFAELPELKVSQVRLYTGQSALSSGFGAAVVASNQGWSLLSEYNSSTGKFILTKKTSSYGNFGLVVGSKSALLIGPVWNISKKYFSAKSILAAFWGEPGSPDWGMNFGLSYQAISFRMGNAEMGYALLHYLKEEPKSLPYIKYTAKFGSAVSADVSWTYNVRDQEPMFLVSGAYTL